MVFNDPSFTTDKKLCTFYSTDFTSRIRTCSFWMCEWEDEWPANQVNTRVEAPIVWITSICNYLGRVRRLQWVSSWLRPWNCTRAQAPCLESWRIGHDKDKDKSTAISQTTTMMWTVLWSRDSPTINIIVNKSITDWWRWTWPEYARWWPHQDELPW